MAERVVTRHVVRSPRITKPLTLAVVSDLHDGPYADVLPALQGVDAILIAGDMINRHKPGYDYAIPFLKAAADIAPTFYSIGNHEWKAAERDAYWQEAVKCPVTVLHNRFVSFGEVVIGGLSSAPRKAVDASFLADMEKQEGFRLLLCHHPEYYKRYVAGHDIDLTLAGHAHGGQINLLNRGVYAPGQGVFPRWTHGAYFGGKLLVSRGMTNSSGAPRWGNPCEMILLELGPEE